MKKNLYYSILANLFSFVVSALVIIFVPKMLDNASYGYFQLYLFYTSYIGFFHLGLCDGIYLNYGGYDYDQLDTRKVSGQFWILTIFEIILSIILFLIATNIVNEPNRLIAMSCSIINIIIVIPKTFNIYLLQTTNRIKEYAISTIGEKLIYGFSIVALFIYRSDYFSFVIIGDITGKIVSLLISSYYCKNIIFSGTCQFNEVIKETFYNIVPGAKLMLANISSMLIIGIVRFGIEQNWSIETFGEISLSISISNILLTFITAVGVAVFPILKKMKERQAGNMYMMISNILSIVVLGSFLGYYILSIFVKLWIPSYTTSVRYMSLLFPICVFECKMSLLSNTYLKAYRKENILLLINFLSLLLVIFFSVITICFLKNLNLSILSITFVFAVRSVICSILLNQMLSINDYNVVWDVALSALFILFSNLLETGISFVLYSIAIAIFYFFKKENIKQLINLIRKY